MTRTARLRCPKCGAEMNHHADKPVEPVNRREAALVDPALGAVVQQTHGCPACGNVEFVPSPPSA
jgi:ribosomal protein S27AE